MSADAPAPARLCHWLETLFTAKRKKALDDPELFATYMVLVKEASQVIDGHVAHLVGQLEEIIATGVARGEFAAPDPAVAARAVFDASMRFHNPAHAADWSMPGIEHDFTALCDLVLTGLRPRRG
jgi:hypothetical protein